MRALIVVLLLNIPAWADSLHLQEQAPLQHVVVRGDTLWGISEIFLKDPWQWPRVWNLNRDEIANPHLIYPGDVVRLSRDGEGHVRLILEEGARRSVKLSPHAYAETVEEAGISSIPMAAIEPLLSRGGIGDPDDLARAPRILGSSDLRVMYGLNDLVYAGHGDGNTLDWHIVRLGQPIVNREDGKEVLAYELIDVGDAHTLQAGEPQYLRITRSRQEVLERDCLLPSWKEEPMRDVPHAPDKAVAARVAATLGGAVNAGAWTSVVLDRGLRDGLERGHVLALFRAGRSVADPKCARADKIAFIAGGGDHARDCTSGYRGVLPDTRIGLAFVYRVFNRVSYALVMKSAEQIAPGDLARNP